MRRRKLRCGTEAEFRRSMVAADRSMPRDLSNSLRRPRRCRRVAIIVVVIFAVLVIGGFVAGPVLKSFANRKLAEMKTYTGHIESLSVSLWRGRIDVRDAVFRERDGASRPPLAHVDRADLNVSYWSLLRGKLSAKANVDGAQINVSAETARREKENAPATATPQVTANVSHWQDELRQSFPLEISQLEVSEVKLHFVDESTQPKVDVGLDHLRIKATGLTNRPKENDTGFPAHVDLNAVVTGNGQLKITVDANPTAAQPTFATQVQLRGLSLPAFNSFLQAYANADVSAGTFEFDSEIKAEKGHYDGYVKPFFKDLNFKTASDKDKNAAQLLAKKAVSAVANVLKNKEENKVATKAPFHGNFENNQVDIWETISNLLHNAFVQALREGFEGQRPNG